MNYNLAEAKIPQENYEFLKRSLQRKKGFGLFFVQCYPAQAQKIIEKIRQELKNKKVEVLTLQEETKNLYDTIAEKVQKSPIDILFIQGLEKSLVAYTQAEPTFKPPLTGERNYQGGQGTYYRLHEIPPILAHLNLQRESFKASFPFSLVFLLPKFALKYLIRRSPDFFDWRSGVFEFIRDQELVEQDSLLATITGNYEEYLTLTPQQRYNKILELQDLIAEPLQTKENKADLWLEMGLLYAAGKEYQEALASYDHALQFKPDLHQAWNNRGVALRNLGRYEEALASYDHALQIQPDLHQAWNNRGNALRNLGRIEEAITSYDHALQIQPDLHLAWYNRGNALSNLGRIEEAIASFDHALQIQPDLHQAWNNRGNALGHLGRYEEAIASCDHALQIQPDLHEAWYSRGLALYYLGRYEEAIASWDYALQIQPDLHQAWNNRGGALSDLGRYEEAIADYDHALQIQPDDHEAWYNRGLALSDLGRYEEAIASYDHALQIQPDAPTPFYNKACLYALQGNIDLSLENLQQAINLDEQFQQMAKTDQDFDKIRHDERFQELIQG